SPRCLSPPPHVATVLPYTPLFRSRPSALRAFLTTALRDLGRRPSPRAPDEPVLRRPGRAPAFTSGQVPCAKAFRRQRNGPRHHRSEERRVGKDGRRGWAPHT